MFRHRVIYTLHAAGTVGVVGACGDLTNAKIRLYTAGKKNWAELEAVV